MEIKPQAPIALLEVPEVGRGCYSPADRSRGRRRRRAPLTLSPIEVDAFSVYRTGRFAHDRSMLRSCSCQGDEADAFYDLNVGYSAPSNGAKPPTSLMETAETTTPATDAGVGVSGRVVPDEKLPMEDFLRCLSDNPELLVQLPEIVCMRRTLQFIMCTPYKVQCDGKGGEGWKIAIRKVASSWYLCEIWGQRVRYPNIDRLMFWGSRFEQCMTAPRSAPRSPQASPVAERTQSRGSRLSPRHEGSFYRIAYSLLGDHSLLYAGETDCCRSGKGEGGGMDSCVEYVEVKTNRLCSSRTHEEAFARNKLLHWWAQSYLMGVPTIICGFRDETGVVRQVKEYSTSDLPRLANEGGAQWDPVVCLNFLDQVLRHAKNIATSDECVYVMEFQPTSRTIPTTVHRIIDFPLTFPPQWFCEIVS